MKCSKCDNDSNYETIALPTIYYCAVHHASKIPVPGKTQMVTCIHTDCPIRPRFGIIGKGISHCVTHKHPHMVNLSIINCGVTGCNTRPMFGDEFPVVCGKHTTSGMTQFHIVGWCKHIGCGAVAQFGLRKYIPLNCIDHALPTMHDSEFDYCIGMRCRAIVGFRLTAHQACSKHSNMPIIDGPRSTTHKKCNKYVEVPTEVPTLHTRVVIRHLNKTKKHAPLALAIEALDLDRPMPQLLAPPEQVDLPEMSRETQRNILESMDWKDCQSYKYDQTADAYVSEVSEVSTSDSDSDSDIEIIEGFDKYPVSTWRHVKHVPVPTDEILTLSGGDQSDHSRPQDHSRPTANFRYSHTRPRDSEYKVQSLENVSKKMKM